MCEKQVGIARADRLWWLMVALETVERFPIGNRQGTPLNGTIRRMYCDAVAAAVLNALVSPGGARTLERVIETWPTQSRLIQELLVAIVDDITALRYDPNELVLAVRLLRARRREPMDSGPTV